MTNYKHKYSKYKSKYLSLKNKFDTQIGGDNTGNPKIVTFIPLAIDMPNRKSSESNDSSVHLSISSVSSNSSDSCIESIINDNQR